MIPKKPEDIYKQVSEETPFSEKDVADLVSMFYEEHVSQELQNLNDGILVIEHLGTFRFRRRNSEKAISQINNKRLYFEKEIIAESNREIKTFPKLVISWEKNILKLTEIIKKIENLKKLFDETKEVEQERFKKKIEKYGNI